MTKLDTWKLQVRNWYPREAATFIGNGYIGGGLPLNGHGAASAGCSAAVANYYVGEDEIFPALPHWLNVKLQCDGQVVDPSWVNYEQTFDIRRNTFMTNYTSRDGKIRVSSETICHRRHRHLAQYKICIEALRDVSINVTATLDAEQCIPVPDSSKRNNTQGRCGWELDFGDHLRKAARALELTSNALPFYTHAGPQQIGFHASTLLIYGQTVSFEGRIATAVGERAMESAQAALDAHESEQYDELLATHVAEMKRLWGDFDIRSDDPFLDRRAKAAALYLLSGYRQDVIWGGAATGLAGAAMWGGSIFWDTEFYMFPALLAFWPELARNALRYRHQTLPAAKENASAHGEHGARFAWQSKRSGKPLAGAFENERHVSSDIAYACHWYTQSTGDGEFARGAAREMICEVARNWASRAQFNTIAARWEIHGVIGADEHMWDHHAGALVNNSAMTNAYAAWTLRAAASDPGNNATPAERAQWMLIAERMYLPRDASAGRYLEYEGYDGHPIKQADVGHLFFPLCVDRDADEIRRKINYYADRERETGLYLLHSPFVYAAAMSRANDVDGVRRFLELSARNVTGPFEIPRESNYATGPVVTGAGAFLGILLYAVAGIENCGETLSAHPCVPAELGWIEIDGLHHRGKTFRIRAEAGNSRAQFELMASAEKDLQPCA